VTSPVGDGRALRVSVWASAALSAAGPAASLSVGFTADRRRIV